MALRFKRFNEGQYGVLLLSQIVIACEPGHAGIQEDTQGVQQDLLQTLHACQSAAVAQLLGGESKV